MLKLVERANLVTLCPSAESNESRIAFVISQPAKVIKAVLIDMVESCKERVKETCFRPVPVNVHVPVTIFTRRCGFPGRSRSPSGGIRPNDPRPEEATTSPAIPAARLI